MVVERDKEADLMKLADRVIKELEFLDDCEYGAPGLNDKRPFGNENVEQDILEIIEWYPIDENSDPQGYEEQREYAKSLFREEVVPYIQRQWKKLK